MKINNLGIPPLAGICSYEEAGKTGYEVNDNVHLLKKYNYIETRLHEIYCAHLPSTPEWEVKCAMSLHLWLDAEHSAALRKRVTEMRQPPLHLDKVPDENLKVLLDEVIRSENTLELLVGIYRVIKPQLSKSYMQHLRETNKLTDFPTYRMLKAILQEEEEMVQWGEEAIVALIKTSNDERVAQSWQTHLESLLPTHTESPPNTLRSNGLPYEMDVEPKRDERFIDCFNHTASFSHYFHNESLEDDERVYALIYKRLREMDVPEWMAPIIYKTKGKPWEYYVDLSRQLWDECRHAMMGEVALYHQGMPFYKYPIDMVSSVTINTTLQPIEAHLILWGIEQNLMLKSGKQAEWQIAKTSDYQYVAMLQDYDWADEVLHAQIGRKWLLPDFDSLEDMKATYLMINEKWQESRKQFVAPLEQKQWWPYFLEYMRKNNHHL